MDLSPSAQKDQEETDRVVMALSPSAQKYQEETARVVMALSPSAQKSQEETARMVTMVLTFSMLVLVVLTFHHLLLQIDIVSLTLLMGPGTDLSAAVFVEGV